MPAGVPAGIQPRFNGLMDFVVFLGKVEKD
jgi:hypothetical protein